MCAFMAREVLGIYEVTTGHGVNVSTEYDYENTGNNVDSLTTWLHGSKPKIISGINFSGNWNGP